jgi:uncharacterized protein
MIFEILAERSEKDRKTFFYDNVKNVLSSEDGFIFSVEDKKIHNHISTPFSKKSPLKKSKNITKLKIQMGLSCNYSCDYCSQKFVGRPPETSKKDIEDFMKKLEVLEFTEQQGLSVEFWGGEPFVYWKTMKPLAEAIMEKFSHWKNRPKFSVITNGSILTRDICAWLYYMGFYVSISHDGPGQSVRGPDPFEDEEAKKIVLEFYKIMKPQGRISFNSMLNSKNKDRKAIHDWFINFTGDPQVPLGEGALVDAYDLDGMNNSLSTKQEHFEFRRNSFNDIRSNNGYIGFGTILQKIDGFTNSVMNQQPASGLGQKCGMDDQHVLAIDMKGNVLTCQNVSAVETAMNGESHLGGNLDDYDNVELKSATHWANREECSKCPVLHMCKGSCMFLDGQFWKTTCDNAYSDNIALFALAFEKMTSGYIPLYINSNELPPERKDIWGTILSHKEETPKRIIPIVAVSEKTVLDNVEVYTQARVQE